MSDIAENPVKIGLLDPEIQAVEDFVKQEKKERKFFHLLANISKSLFMSSDSIWLDRVTFEAGDIVCWLVNLPIAKLDLFKSANCRWISKT